MKIKTDKKYAIVDKSTIATVHEIALIYTGLYRGPVIGGLYVNVSVG